MVSRQLYREGLAEERRGRRADRPARILSPGSALLWSRREKLKGVLVGEVDRGRNGSARQQAGEKTDDGSDEKEVHWSGLAPDFHVIAQPVGDSQGAEEKSGTGVAPLPLRLTVSMILLSSRNEGIVQGSAAVLFDFTLPKGGGEAGGDAEAEKQAVQGPGEGLGCFGQDPAADAGGQAEDPADDGDDHRETLQPLEAAQRLPRPEGPVGRASISSIMALTTSKPPCQNRGSVMSTPASPRISAVGAEPPWLSMRR